jgi:transposase
MASRAQWARTVAQWKKSGLTAEVFAEQQGLNVRSLQRWSSALQRASASADQTGFTRVIPIDSGANRATEPATVEVVLASGRVVRVGKGFDPGLLREVVTALEAS